MDEILKWSCIPYELDHCWWKPIVIGILDSNNMISYGVCDNVSHWVILRKCVQLYCDQIVP